MKIAKVILLSLLMTFALYSFNATSSEERNIKIFKENRESVVFISTQESVIDYYSLNRFTLPKGSGSGFIWDKEGHIVTNYHVIEGASSAKVKLYNGKSYDAKLIGLYPKRDIAVLKIDAPKKFLKPVKLGSSANLEVGQEVYAIGNPYGLDWTMTKGIVSAINRKVPLGNGLMISGAIQTDAAINPGNSGGVMLDSKGRLIGVNSAIYTPSGGSVGIGFAIQIDLVKRVVQKLIANGSYIKPTIGIESDDRINNYLKSTLGIKGVAVLGLVSGSDAQRVGLQSAKFYSDGTIDFGDIIVAINGKKVESIYDLDDVLERLQIGDSVTLDILRGKKIIQKKVKLIGLESI